MGLGVSLSSGGVYSKFQTPDQMSYHRNYGYTGEPADGLIAGYGTRPCSYGPAATVYPELTVFERSPTGAASPAAAVKV